MLIGRVILKHNRNSNKLYTVFEPAIKAVKVVSNPKIDCENSEEAITEYIKNSVAQWFESVDQVVLADEETKQIKIVREVCKKYPTGQLKEAVFQIVQEDVVEATK